MMLSKGCELCIFSSSFYRAGQEVLKSVLKHCVLMCKAVGSPIPSSGSRNCLTRLAPGPVTRKESSLKLSCFSACHILFILLQLATALLNI